MSSQPYGQSRGCSATTDGIKQNRIERSHYSLGRNAIKGLAEKQEEDGVADGSRTHHLRSHNPVLCLMSYGHHQMRMPHALFCGKVVGVERFELPTSCSQSRRATRLRYTPNRDIQRREPLHFRPRMIRIDTELVNGFITLLLANLIVR